MSNYQPTTIDTAVGVPPVARTTTASPVGISPISTFGGSGGRPSLGPRRQSRFTEDVMMEHTPANSISEMSMQPADWYGPAMDSVTRVGTPTSRRSQQPSTRHPHPLRYSVGTETGTVTETRSVGAGTQSWIRLANGCLHPVPLLVLLYVMAQYQGVLRDHYGDHMGIQSLIIIIVLLLDATLDVVTLVRVHKPWPTWALMLRLAYGSVYIVMFIVYAVLGRVFPEGSKYWGLPAGSASTVVHVLLWIPGIWNPFHLLVCRCHLASIFHICLARPRSRPRHDIFGSHDVSRVTAEASSISLTWRRWVGGSDSRPSFHHHPNNHQHYDVETGRPNHEVAITAVAKETESIPTKGEASRPRAESLPATIVSEDGEAKGDEGKMKDEERDDGNSRFRSRVRVHEIGQWVAK